MSILPIVTSHVPESWYYFRIKIISLLANIGHFSNKNDKRMQNQATSLAKYTCQMENGSKRHRQLHEKHNKILAPVASNSMNQQWNNNSCYTNENGFISITIILPP